MAADKVRIGILGTAPSGRGPLREALQKYSIDVVVEETLAQFLSDIECQNDVDVLVLDLERANDEDLDVLDALMEHSPVPMVFYDGGGRAGNARWWENFAAKVVGAAAHRPPRPQAPPPTQEPAPAQSDRLIPNQRVWVLGASFGGPEALKRFLSALPERPGLAMIIAQHIGDGFVEVLAAQLNRVTKCRVVPATTGVRIEDGRIFVAPVDARITIDADGYVQLRPHEQRLSYRPSIDGLMEEVARRYGSNAGAIVFSGMGDDGARGCCAIANAGGTVWAQDRASCAIDSMPLHACATGVVARTGTPEELAHALAAYAGQGK